MARMKLVLVRIHFHLTEFSELHCLSKVKAAFKERCLSVKPICCAPPAHTIILCDFI